MGESTCLLRSISNPTDTSPCMAKKGDPIRLLGESISFGRYMTEGLDWEKWSVFSHNRYVEEAEKFSRPGSVAAKKAYFEAHYKKKAAQKAAALVEEADVSVNQTFDYETQDGNCNNTFIQINFKENSNVIAIEQHYQVVDYADTNEGKCDADQSEVGISKMELPEDVAQPLVDYRNVENFVIVDNSNQLDNAEKVVVPKEEKQLDLGNPGKRVKAREVNSSPKSSTKATLFKPLYFPAERKATLQPGSRISSVPNSKRSVGGLAEKKKLSTAPLHMSINLPSCAGETSKTASVLQQNRRRKTNFISPNISRDHPVASRTSVRAISDAFNRASLNHHSEGRSTERQLNKSVFKGVTASAELSSVGFAKSPSTRCPQSSTVSSPLRFRSEERASKRKEFFRRMDEIKSKEAERVQLQRRCKEKTEHDPKKLQQCYGFKLRQNEYKNALQLPSNEMRKSSLTESQSSKSGSKATSNTCHDGKNSRNSWKPPTGISIPKRATEKTNQTMRGSVSSLSKKVRQENAPPNIQP